MSKILFVLSEYEPFQSSGINRLKYFKRYLEDRGHYVAVLTTTSSAQGVNTHKEFDAQHHIYRAYSLGLLPRRLLSSRRMPIYQTISLEGKYSAWKYFAVQYGARLVRQLDIDYIFTSFPDFSSVNAASKIAKKSNKKLIVDFRDPPYWVYESNVDNRKTTHCKKIIFDALNTSDQIVCATAKSKESMMGYYDVNNIMVVGNGYDESIISELKSRPSREDGFIELVHIGSFYANGRDIDRVIRSLDKNAAKIKDKYNKIIKLRLIGDQPERRTIELINSTHSVQVQIEAPVTPAEALDISKQADILLLLQGSLFDRQIPAKIYEYLALNRPIWAVVGAKGATHSLLKDYIQNVVIADYDDEDDIEKTLEAIVVKKANNIECSELSRKQQCQPLATLFDSI